MTRSSVRRIARLLARASFAAGVATLVAMAPAFAADFDRRTTLPSLAPPLPAAAERQALEAWRRAVPDLRHELDPVTGATRTLGNAVGFLVDATAPGDAETIARAFARDQLALLRLTAADLEGAEVTDRMESRLSGVTHLYLGQRYRGIPVYNGLLHVNVAADGRILSVNNLFVPRLAAALNTTEPAIGPDQAFDSLREHLDAVALADPAAPARRMILPIEPGAARLVWSFEVESRDRRHAWQATVDAVDGRVWTLVDRVAHASYQVYEQPIEHPGYATPAPPADARTIAVDPHDTLASPFGWHDTDGITGAESTLTMGNNVDACIDADVTAGQNNVCDPGSRPDGGAGLTFAAPLDLTLEPAANRPAAVINLFYWMNVVHDIEYLYGFDEVGGNFQVNNYGRGGTGGDPILAEAQEGSGTCGGNFSVLPDGNSGRLQAFICGFSGPPARDGAFDHFVQIHELGHGISNRLVGGPGNTSCLSNAEQPGEGLSDLWGLTLTATAAQTGPTPREVGTWLFSPAGIRPFPFSTDNGENPVTYGSTNTQAVPHGTGFVWAQIYWEVYWALVDEHGFDPDLYGVSGTGADAGNLRAKLYLIEGLKNSVCGPGFVNVRDGILAAAASSYGGEDVCTLWHAFAGAGLGSNASQGSANSATDQTEGFAVPSSCSFGNAGNDARVCRTAGSHVQSILVGPGFTSPPVTMSASGNPSPSTTLFSENPVSGPLPETITLTLGNLATVAAGTYTIEVEGDDGVNVGTSDFDLTVDAAAPAAPALTSPGNSTSGHPTQPTFTWAALATAASYVLEVDDDSDFSSITYTASPTTNSHVPTTALPANTLLHWRVRAVNTCGTGVDSAVFNFVASEPSQFCNTTPLVIPDSPAPAASSNLVIPSGGPLNDLDISLRANHTWVGDVQFTLSNGGAPVSFYDRPGRTTSGFGCSGDNIDVIVNDEGPDGNVESQCGNLPAISGDRIGGDPASSTLLAVFDGQPLADTWTLTAQDFAGGDTGTVLEWCLQTSDTMPFIDGFEPGTTARWSSTVN